MKNIKLIIAAVALSSASFSIFAADLVNSQPADQQVMGTISVSGATDINSLQDSLALKAEQAGAKSFRITGAGGNNQLQGTAIIYK